MLLSAGPVAAMMPSRASAAVSTTRPFVATTAAGVKRPALHSSEHGEASLPGVRSLGDIRIYDLSEPANARYRESFCVRH